MKSIAKRLPAFLLLITMCVTFIAPAAQAAGRYLVDELTGMGETASAGGDTGTVSGGIQTYASGVQSRVYNEGEGYLYDYVLRTTGKDTLTRENWLNHLLSHSDDDYYLGTVFPYGGGARGYSDYRNPNGNVSTADEQWGTDNYAYQAGMNCTGFVWSVLWNISGLDYETAFDVLPCMGAYKYNSDPLGYRGMGNWKWFLNGGSDTAGAGDKNVEYKTYWLSYSSSDDPDDVFDQLLDAVFEDGYAEIGDIIYTWDGDNGTFNEGTGTDTQALGNDHIGILSCNYFESGGQDTSMTERTWWNSMPDRAGHSYAPYENVLGPINPCSNYCCALTVVKIQAPAAGGDVVYMTYNGETAWWYVVDGVVQTDYTGVANYSNEYGWWYIKDGKVDFSFTGLAQNDYGWWYVEDGKVIFAEDGFIEGTVNGEDGLYEVIGGQVQLGHTGISDVYSEDGWWYVENGRVDFSYNGFAQNETGWWYVEDGKVNLSEDSVAEGTVNGEDGWYEVAGGQVQLDHTGVSNVCNDTGWWYVVNGKVDFSKNSVEQNDFGWWYIKDGKVDFSYTGFARNDYGWWYIESGKVIFSTNSVIEGTVNGTSGWYEVAGGQVQLSHTGVSNVCNDYGWWYVKNGKVDFSKNSVEQNNYGWWYVNDGKVNFSYTGVGDYCNDYGWWYIRDGKVDFSRTSIEQNRYGWWRIVDGKVDFSCNSVEQNDYGWWYVLGGKVDFGYTGVANYANAYGWWYISNGKVDFSKTSVEQNNYGWWRVSGGKVDFSFHGLATNSWGTWYISGGKVDFGYNGTYDGRTIVNGKTV